MPHPRFAIISAVYNVSSYLPEYFASLDAQTYPHDRIRVVLVNDGSLDGSEALCEEWARLTDIRVEVIHQENAGQAAARNAGIGHLQDEDWVTFTDPDDFLDAAFFTEISKYLESDDDVELVAGHHIDYWEDEPDRGDSHALRFRFASGNRSVDLERYPRNFHMHVASSCLRVDVLRKADLLFDVRVRPVFEDAHLLAKYLLEFDRPVVAFLDTAQYHYRRRGDGSSTMQNAKTDPRRYTDVLEFGTLDLLHHAIERKGRVPDWVQYEVIYDLTWIYRNEDALHGTYRPLSLETCDRYHQLAGAALRMLDPMNIEGYSDVKRTTAQREAMVHGYAEHPWRWDAVVIDGVDEEKGLVKLVYHFTGASPEEEIRVGGRPVEPRHAKTRDFTYLRRTLLHERVLWVPLNGTLSVRLDGQSVPLTSQWPGGAMTAVRPAQVRRMRKQDQRGAANVIEVSRHSKTRKQKLTDGQKKLRRAEMLAVRPPFKKMFRDAWVLMDRSQNAHDNAEHLFRYLRSSRREINAWFVVKKGSPDWDRLRAEGFKRLIPHGSLLWMILCLNATHMISSHIDQYVVEPFARRGGWRWKYVFLQHGVTQADLSRWLNTKTVDLVVTASRDERDSIAGDGSNYIFTTKEVVRTGFPRHDRLVKISRVSDQRSSRKHILLMPTWRAYFSGAVKAGTGERALNPLFFESQFATEWRSLASSQELQGLGDRHGVEIVFMPHPNLEPYLGGFDLPPHVRVVSYAEADVQEMIAGAAVVVTDYSSIAFDAAVAERPVIYFQFDRGDFLSGGHIGRPGYFDYEGFGFGPVVGDVAGVIAEGAEVAEQGFRVPEPYAARTEAVFGGVRGGASKRVVEAIEELRRPLSRRELGTPVPTPPAPPIAYEQ